jgi:hypothetical protein
MSFADSGCMTSPSLQGACPGFLVQSEQVLARHLDGFPRRLRRSQATGVRPHFEIARLVIVLSMSLNGDGP